MPVQTQQIKFVPEGGTGTIPVTLNVRDWCSDEDVAAATVYLDGKEMGATDADGRIYLGELVAGQEYALRITKTGYQDSDADRLANDAFTVGE